jgi:ribosomal protein S18 acetylase RimI-like enzyme
MSGGAGQPAISLRPIEPGDQPFLLALYGSTREQELARAPFTAEQRAAFVAHQFDAQSRHYAQFRDTTFELVLVDGEPAGRLLLGRWERELRIVDVALMPAFRGRGVGTRLLAPVIAEAEARGVPTTIHVERENPAQRLYARLGFAPVADEGVYQRWERPPGGGGGADDALGTAG